MALGEVRLLHWWRVLRRELLCGVGLGAALCAIGMTRIMICHGISGAYGEHFARLALTVGTSLIGVVLFGTLMGSMLPLMLRAWRLVIYFSMAKVFILGVLP